MESEEFQIGSSSVLIKLPNLPVSDKAIIPIMLYLGTHLGNVVKLIPTFLITLTIIKTCWELPEAVMALIE
jgi:hypothetical protein